MSQFVALAASGLALGAILALVGVGVIVLYSATGVVNFAHGGLVTLGAYVGVWAIVDLGLPTFAGYAVSLVVLFLVGVCIEVVAYAPLRRRPQLVVVVATLAAAIVIEALCSLWQGNTPRLLASPFTSSTVHVAGAAIALQRVVIIIVSAVVIAALLLVFHRTSFGRQLRALASDPEAAQLYGVRTRVVSVTAFGLSAMLAALAGILIAPLTSVNLTLGFALMLPAFAAATVGGFGNLTGVVVGGLAVGLVQQLLGGYVFVDYADTLPYVMMFLIIAARPEGLLGGAGRSRL